MARRTDDWRGIGSVSTKSTSAPPPASSWWVGLTPDAFYRRVRAEYDRMTGVTVAPPPPVDDAGDDADHDDD